MKERKFSKIAKKLDKGFGFEIETSKGIKIFESYQGAIGVKIGKLWISSEGRVLTRDEVIFMLGGYIGKYGHVDFIKRNKGE